MFWFSFHLKSAHQERTMPPARLSHCNTTPYQWHSCMQRRKAHWSWKVINRNNFKKSFFFLNAHYFVNVIITGKSFLKEIGCTDSLIRGRSFASVQIYVHYPCTLVMSHFHQRLSTSDFKTRALYGAATFSLFCRSVDLAVVILPF